MRMRQKLAGAAMAIAALAGGAAAVAATATSAAATTAACGWARAPIAAASSASGGTVELWYDSCDRYVRAYAYDLPDNGTCHDPIGCVGTVSKVRVYNKDTGQEAASGTIDASSYTTSAIDDAGTESRACFQNGTYNPNGSVNWGSSTCTVYY